MDANNAAKPENAPTGCVGPQSEQAGKASGCAGCPNRAACASGASRGPDPALKEVADRMTHVKHKILILSGKGGVGKSMVSSQLAWLLSMKKQVGILDIDLCGPSIPRIMGVESDEVHQSASGWDPVYVSESLGVMSIGFMLQNKTDAIIWRGPRKNGIIKQFLTDVNWGDIDFLLVDSPPGTSDEHISVAMYMKEANLDGAVIVTTPQEVSLLDVRKEITFCNKVGIKVLGVVENMSGFVCPHCKECTEIFFPTTGGAKAMCQEMNVPFLGAIPLDPQVTRAIDGGECYFAKHPESASTKAFTQVLDNIMKTTPQLTATYTATD